MLAKLGHCHLTRPGEAKRFLHYPQTSSLVLSSQSTTTWRGPTGLYASAAASSTSGGLWHRIRVLPWQGCAQEGRFFRYRPLLREVVLLNIAQQLLMNYVLLRWTMSRKSHQCLIGLMTVRRRPHNKYKIIPFVPVPEMGIGHGQAFQIHRRKHIGLSNGNGVTCTEVMDQMKATGRIPGCPPSCVEHGITLISSLTIGNSCPDVQARDLELNVRERSL